MFVGFHRFIYVPAPHTAERLASILLQCLMDWNIDSKISTITLDNCSTNDSMVEKVKPKLLSNFLIREGALLHMRCAAHIRNLIVKDGLAVIKDGLVKIRESCAFWLATPRRLEKFQETAKQLRIVSQNRLVLDCPTRWNSTHAMLETAIPNMNVFKRLAQRDPSYTSLPDDTQWQFASIISEKLGFFTPITKLFSGNNYPTTNLFFSRVCDLKLKLMDWMDDFNPVIRSMATSMDMKFQKYWNDIHDLLSVAVVLDLRCKLEIVEFYAAKFARDDYEPDLHSLGVRQLLSQLVHEYQNTTRIVINQSSTSTPNPDSGSGSSAASSDFEHFVRERKKSRMTVVQSELDHYLADDVAPNTKDFDLLGWWKTNAAKYPTLADMARDFLAVPITSVASESAFSSGGRLLDPHRSRLHQKNVEALMCTRSWMQDDLKTGKFSSNSEIHHLNFDF